MHVLKKEITQWSEPISAKRPAFPLEWERRKQSRTKEKGERKFCDTLEQTPVAKRSRRKRRKIGMAFFFSFLPS
jgi:hypothetical protein